MEVQRIGSDRTLIKVHFEVISNNERIKGVLEMQDRSFNDVIRAIQGLLTVKPIDISYISVKGL